MASIKKGEVPKPKAANPEKLKGGGKAEKGSKAPPATKIKGGKAC